MVEVDGMLHESRREQAQVDPCILDFRGRHALQGMSAEVAESFLLLDVLFADPLAFMPAELIVVDRGHSTLLMVPRICYGLGPFRKIIRRG